MNRSSYYKRLSYGYSVEEAHTLPKNKPRWMQRIEDEEQMPMRDLLAHAAVMAVATGYTCADLAREWGVHKDTLGYWARKWGIRFPRNVSELQREKARATIEAVNKRRIQC